MITQNEKMQQEVSCTIAEHIKIILHSKDQERYHPWSSLSFPCTLAFPSGTSERTKGGEKMLIHECILYLQQLI